MFILNKQVFYLNDLEILEWNNRLYRYNSNLESTLIPRLSDNFKSYDVYLSDNNINFYQYKFRFSIKKELVPIFIDYINRYKLVKAIRFFNKKNIEIFSSGNKITVKKFKNDGYISYQINLSGNIPYIISLMNIYEKVVSIIAELYSVTEYGLIIDNVYFSMGDVVTYNKNTKIDYLIKDIELLNLEYNESSFLYYLVDNSLDVSLIGNEVIRTTKDNLVRSRNNLIKTILN